MKGKRAVELAKICEKFSAIAAVQTSDLKKASRAVQTPILAQQADDFESIKKYSVGSLVNHSDHPLTMMKIKKTIQQLRKNKLISIACAKNSKQAGQIAKYKPDIIAIEPPELIGGNKSVSKAKPKEIIDTIKKSRGIPVFCGAGIRTRQDVKIAQKLGVQGILISSGVVKAKEPRKALKELTIGF